MLQYKVNMDQTRKKDKYPIKLKYYTRPNLLIIDNWIPTPTTIEQQEDILEFFENFQGKINDLCSHSTNEK